MIEFQFYNHVNLGAENQTKSRKVVLNQELSSKLDWEVVETFLGS